jgi:hypothetical protein
MTPGNATAKQPDLIFGGTHEIQKIDEIRQSPGLPTAHCAPHASQCQAASQGGTGIDRT